MRLAGRAWYETLVGSGVRVYEWQPAALNAKEFVVDGQWVTGGWMNFNSRSMPRNDKVTLMVLGTLSDDLDRIFFDDCVEAGDHRRSVPCAIMAAAGCRAGANWMTRLP